MRLPGIRLRHSASGDSIDRLPSVGHQRWADLALGQERCRSADLLYDRSPASGAGIGSRDNLRGPTKLLPLVDSVLMTPAARWRSSGGRR